MIGLFNRDLSVSQIVDRFYYIQKHQELQTLEEKLDEAVQRTVTLMNELESCYGEVSAKWRHDMQWLNKRARARNETIFHSLNVTRIGGVENKI